MSPLNDRYLSIISSNLGHQLFGQISMNKINSEATFQQLVFFVGHLH